MCQNLHFSDTGILHSVTQIFLIHSSALVLQDNHGVPTDKTVGARGVWPS